MILNFFCDIDGTLLPFGKGLMESTRASIEKARKQGHRFFLATGRSMKEIDPRLSVITFDGGVYSNGVTVKLGNKTVLDEKMTQDDMSYLRAYSEENSFLYMLQSDDGTYMTEECRDFFVSSMRKHLGRVIDVPNIIVYEKGKVDDFGSVRKFLFLSPDHRMDEARESLPPRFQVIDNTVGIPQSDMAEICLPSFNKGTGVEALIRALGDDMASSVAIGDGANDIEMLSMAELGIAMGNAPEDVKKHAKWVTSSVDDDGFSRAVEYALKTLA